MINSITLKGVATYDPTDGVLIDNLKKVNFLYGTNGCGKTTLSNFLQESANPKFMNCKVSWKDEQPITTLVYNKAFREHNFGKGNINGIFTLGQATTDEIKVIEEKQEELKKLKDEGTKIKDTLKVQIDKKNKVEKEFTEECWKKIYKKYEKEFKDAFVGSMKSGELFKTRFLKEFSSNTANLESIELLREKAKTIFGEVPQKIIPINDFSYENILFIEKDSIWNKIIVGKADVDIAKLIQKLNINDWVNEGRNYIEEDETCPFCQQQTITEDFRNQLESFFDEVYVNDLKKIKDLKQEYNNSNENIINELNSIETEHKNLKGSKLDINKFSAYLKTLISQNTTNNELLNSKIKEPSRKIELVSLKEQLDLIKKLIDTANQEIKKHNEIVENFISEKNKLIQEIWKFLVEEFRVDITKYNSNITGLDSGISKLEANRTLKLEAYKALKSEITKLSKNVTSIQPTVDEINKLLKAYGFLNFKIVPATEDGFYQIQREDGEIAETTLSEGEITFITFLYYLQLAKGGLDENTVNDDRILVIDDPISSLDSNVLFVVSTLIKEILKEVRNDIGSIKQVILLTHNIYFHKEASFEGINRGKGEKNQYYILRKVNSVTKSYSYLDKNPISSSYELLWNEIKDYEKNSGITVQNAMRRVIENYFSILGNKRDETLLSKFPNPQEKEIFRSLLSWINEGSHTLPDDLYVELPDQSIETYLKVFKEIFLYTHNIGHYNMMMGIEENEDIY
ncbi:AAA family ATPase [Paenimyroides aestuarii]|uniref:AAA family ATPase n=1 Tax=Paenimyroides aestuarii TaxID=2968490 RepID=A0ABY5NQQ3_9FLAO|nr:AAA family ATPase [Paenimyroides aestuarii]UUV20890.1 AAA family ATPase [Paenimyroides aestuarii]